MGFFESKGIPLNAWHNEVASAVNIPYLALRGPKLVCPCVGTSSVTAISVDRDNHGSNEASNGCGEFGHFLLIATRSDL